MNPRTQDVKAFQDRAAQPVSRAYSLAEEMRRLIQPENTGQLAISISRDMAVEIAAALEGQK